MFELTSVHLWIFIAYVVGTLFGRVSIKSKFQIDTGKIIEATIDRLIADGYVKSRKTENGEVELVRYNEDI